MQILQHPNPILEQVSEPVTEINDELKTFAKDLYETMKSNNGIGISAVQVGKLIRLIIIEENGKPLYMINPKIIKYSIKKVKDNEGCLSFKGQYYKISRSYEVDAMFTNLNKKAVYRKFKGLLARAVIHECEHLDGKLFIEKVNLEKEKV